MTESALVRALLLASSKAGVALFRNNVGKLQDRHGTWVAYGLCPGSCDLIGWTPHVVTQADVGRTMAVFVGIEAKRESGGTVSEDQRAFLAALARDGAVCGVARSVADLDAILQHVKER